MKQAPHEQLALRVIGLVLVAGVGVWYGSQRSAPEWRIDDALGAGAAGAELERLAARAEHEQARSRRRALPLAPGERIDPNTADADELQRLPRVGPSLAARILEHREAHGPFRTLADLDAVPGVGPAVLEGVAPLLTLPPAPARAEPGPAGRRIDINTASADELATLPGVGPVLAARIVATRREHGPFRSVGDLERVPGIGPRLARRLAPHLRLAP